MVSEPDTSLVTWGLFPLPGATALIKERCEDLSWLHTDHPHHQVLERFQGTLEEAVPLGLEFLCAFRANLYLSFHVSIYLPAPSRPSHSPNCPPFHPQIHR